MNKEKLSNFNLEFSIYRLFRENLPEEFDILPSPQTGNTVRPDLTISRGDARLAIVEVKTEKAYQQDKEGVEKEVTNLAIKEGFRFAIIASDEKTFRIKDRFSVKVMDYKPMALEVICHVLDTVRDTHHIANIGYREGLFGWLDDIFSVISDDANKKYLSFKEKNSETKFLIDDETFFFQKEEVEDELFGCLLRRFEEDEVCRYTSLSSLFRTIRSGEQSMCCIVGMNDKSECTYADSYIRAANNTGTQPIKTIYDAGEENKYFILSCMDTRKYDDLTMWRLYGDNTKGVNIKYGVDKSKLNKFKLYHIDYAETPGLQGHKALNIIRQLLNFKVGGRSFRLRRWNEWKHFFKPYEYRDELEIRLLYNRQDHPADEWILTGDYSIVCPLAKFELKDFPFVIEEIKLGPNCPDMETNRLQLKLIIKELRGKLALKNNKDVVMISEIGTYR